MTTNSILNLTFTQLREKYINLELKPSDVTQAYLAQLHNTNELNHTITFCDELALTQAARADQAYKNGTYKFLEGMPLCVKDLFCTNQILTTAGSKMLSNFVPSYESIVTQKAFDQGAIMLSKTNMDEFAMGASNKYSAYGPALNPWNKACVTGGSSGGSAGAVAAKGCLFALGSDTGGSVRQPAAFCGIVGIRPTYGRCSRRGMIAFCSSLDQAGVFGRDVRSCAALLETIMGYDEYDSTSAKKAVPNLMSITDDVEGLTIGVLTDSFVTDPSIKAQYQQTQHMLEKLGAKLVDVDIKYMAESLAVYYVIAPVEAASNLARYDGIRYGLKGEGDTYEQQCMDARKHFGEEAKRRILLGTYFSSHEGYGTYFKQAIAVKNALTQEFNKAFSKCDLLISPTTPHTAFELNAKKTPVEMYYEDYYTCPINLAGICGISVPVGLADNGLPVGMQIIAPAWREDMLIKGGLALEKAVNFEYL